MPLFPHIHVNPITYDVNNKKNTDCFEIYKRQKEFIYLYNERWSSFIAETKSTENGGTGNGDLAKSKSNIIDLYMYGERQKKIIIGLCTMSNNISENILHIYLAFTQLKYMLIQTKNIFNKVYFSSVNNLLGFSAAISLGVGNLSSTQTYVYFKLKQFFSFSHYGAKLKTLDDNDLKIIPDEQKFLENHITYLTKEDRDKILNYDREFANTPKEKLTYKYTRIFTDDFRITEFENYPLYKTIGTITFKEEPHIMVKNTIIVDHIRINDEREINLDYNYDADKNVVYFKLNISSIRDYYNKILLYVLFNRIDYLIKNSNNTIRIIMHPENFLSKISIPESNIEIKSILNNLETSYKVKIRQFFENSFANNDPDITFITLDNEILELNNTIKHHLMHSDKSFADLKKSEQDFKEQYPNYITVFNNEGYIKEIKKYKIAIFI